MKTQTERPTPETDAFFRPDAQHYPAAKKMRIMERQRDELLEALEEYLSEEEQARWVVWYNNFDSAYSLDAEAIRQRWEASSEFKEFNEQHASLFDAIANVKKGEPKL